MMSSSFETADVEAAAGLRDEAHQRPVGVVPHQKAEDAHVVLLQELVELLRIDDALVRDAVGDEKNARRAIGFDCFQPLIETLVDIRPALGAQLLHLLPSTPRL